MVGEDSPPLVEWGHKRKSTWDLVWVASRGVCQFAPASPFQDTLNQGNTRDLPKLLPLGRPKDRNPGEQL